MTTKNELPAILVPPGPGETGRSRWEITDKGLQLITELAGKGCHQASIATALGMSHDTFSRLRKSNEAVNEAYETGVAVEHDILVSNLQTAAQKGNIVASIFLLKTRHKYREEDKVGLNVNVDSQGGVLVVPERKSVDEWLKENEAKRTIDANA